MIELFPEGFEEIERNGELELAVYGNAGAEERLWHAFGPGVARSVSAGWESAWRRFHRPVRIGPLWVGPPWEPPDPDALAVVIEPGRAFGTGGHATTRLCLELLVELERASFVDVGCGSGVLAIAAVRLGFAPVYALDADESAVQAAAANAAANRVEVDVRRCDVFVAEIPRARTAVANIDRAAVETVAGRLARAGTRVLITSGYLAAERPRLSGWRQWDRREAEGWAADLFERS
jgi:ribosomal protein L11 methyltransferase